MTAETLERPSLKQQLADREKSRIEALKAVHAKLVAEPPFGGGYYIQRLKEAGYPFHEAFLRDVGLTMVEVCSDMHAIADVRAWEKEVISAYDIALQRVCVPNAGTVLARAQKQWADGAGLMLPDETLYLANRQVFPPELNARVTAAFTILRDRILPLYRAVDDAKSNTRSAISSRKYLRQHHPRAFGLTSIPIAPVAPVAPAPNKAPAPDPKLTITQRLEQQFESREQARHEAEQRARDEATALAAKWDRYIAAINTADEAAGFDLAEFEATLPDLGLTLADALADIDVVRKDREYEGQIVPTEEIERRRQSLCDAVQAAQEDGKAFWEEVSSSLPPDALVAASTLVADAYAGATPTGGFNWVFRSHIRSAMYGLANSLHSASAAIKKFDALVKRNNDLRRSIAETRAAHPRVFPAAQDVTETATTS